MTTLIVFGLSVLMLGLAYRFYARFLAERVFALRDDEPMPSETLRDDVDFVPTNRFVLFGHHFTSIAGTGPIVGPAIAVMWGWLPALIWVVVGAIFIGGVHDFAALVASLRHRGKTIGDVAGDVISPTARFLFLIMLAFLLAIVVAIVANVIASIFTLYPRSVFPVWCSLPMAMVLGVAVHRFRVSLLWLSLAALVLLYAAVVAGCYWLPPLSMPTLDAPIANPVMLWTLVLLVYCFAASVLPVWLLLQPRDYINSQQLYLALVLVVVGLVFAAIMGKADIATAAPAMRLEEASQHGVPPLFPFLLITVACGAVSGFHALVSSGTTSKQLASMRDAPMVSYGGMLLEAFLAVVVIIACTAGIGMGLNAHATSEHQHIAPFSLDSGEMLTGRAAWESRYDMPFKQMNLAIQVATFIEGSSNFIEGIGVPPLFAHALMAVLLACFAATTIDTTTRLFRYIVQEIGRHTGAVVLENRYAATLVAVLSAAALALARPVRPDGSLGDYGTGGMILWPLFGAGNQLLAGMTFLVAIMLLVQRRTPWRTLAVPLVIPAVMMLVIPVWAMSLQIIGWGYSGQTLLASLGTLLVVLAGIIAVAAIRALWSNRSV